MTLNDARLAASSLTARQMRDLDRLSEVVLGEERPALVGRDGVRLELPEPLLQLLAGAVQNLRAGNSMVLLPEMETLTTQAAADFLGVSRPFLVALMEKGDLPHHKVGAHRRVYLKDLLDYQHRRDGRRRAILDDLRSQVEAAGLYERAVDEPGDER